MEPEQPKENEGELEGRGPVAQVFRVNLIILAAYAGLAFVSVYLFNSNGDLGEVAVMVGLGMVAQGVINLILGVLFFIMKKTGYGKGALLFGLLYLIIGFSTCAAFFTLH